MSTSSMGFLFAVLDRYTLQPIDPFFSTNKQGKKRNSLIWLRAKSNLINNNNNNTPCKNHHILLFGCLELDRKSVV